MPCPQVLSEPCGQSWAAEHTYEQRPIDVRQVESISPMPAPHCDALLQLLLFVASSTAAQVVLDGGAHTVAMSPSIVGSLASVSE